MLSQSRERFDKIVQENSLLEADVPVFVKILSSEEAIGNTGRRDFPIAMGKEMVIEADFQGARAHVFTEVAGI